ncbi:MAG: CinA family protein [Alistipes indistinctus]
MHPAAAFGLRNRSGEGPQQIGRQFDRLTGLIPHYLVGYGDDTTRIGDRIAAAQPGQTLATAESRTGGNIAHRFTAMPGASDYFLGGVVAYSNEVKTALLGVDPDSLNRYGAVSRSIAEQMAEGVRRATGATYGISTTGTRGPTGGTPGKPVGTVWMAVATPEGYTPLHGIRIGTRPEHRTLLVELHQPAAAATAGFRRATLSDNI